jgi:nucleoside-diphosphate-sugar epimerase
MNKINKVLVMGGNGYVGNYVLKTFAQLAPEKTFIGMSRGGSQREGDKVIGTLGNVCFIQGDALNPDSYKSQLQDVDAVIHTLGVLLPGSGPDRSFEAMNCDAAVNVANDLDKWA